MSLFLGEKIRSLRQEKNLTQHELSSKVLSRPTLSKIESNKVSPSIEQLEYLSQKLEVPITYFFLSDLSNELYYPSNHISMLYNSEKYADIATNYETQKYNYTLIDLYYIGMSYFMIDLFHQSAKLLKKFICLYKSENLNIKRSYCAEIAVALNTLAKIVLKNKNYEKALKYLFAASNHIYSYNYTDKEIYFIINNNISSIYCILGKYCSVKEELEKFLSKNSNFYYNKIVAGIYLNLNISYFHIGDYKTALDYIKKAIFLFNVTNDTYHEGECYMNYLNCLRYLSKFEEGILLVNDLIKNENYCKELHESYKLQGLIINYNSENIDYIINNYTNIEPKFLKKKNLMNYYFICGYAEYTELNYIKSHKYFLKCENFLIKNNRYLDLGTMYKIFAHILDAEEYIEKSKHYLALNNTHPSSLSVNITLPEKT
ncbi:helix-turn-helix transcriptional regulator [Clostridium sp.]|uniref:helix-turn-helix transcriptional regulator n=1 Tax=Clostridium sp. TaxID=1506 RepID=UPI002FC6CFBA